MTKKTCRYIVYHPQTAEEKANVKYELDYARSIGDSYGVIIRIAQLAGCPKVVRA